MYIWWCTINWGFSSASWLIIYIPPPIPHCPIPKCPPCPHCLLITHNKLLDIFNMYLMIFDTWSQCESAGKHNQYTCRCADPGLVRTLGNRFSAYLLKYSKCILTVMNLCIFAYYIPCSCCAFILDIQGHIHSESPLLVGWRTHEFISGGSTPHEITKYCI